MDGDQQWDRVRRVCRVTPDRSRNRVSLPERVYHRVDTNRVDGAPPSIYIVSVRSLGRVYRRLGRVVVVDGRTTNDTSNPKRGE